MKPRVITLSSQKITLVLAVLSGVLIVIHAVLFYGLADIKVDQVTWNFMELFDLDAEVSIPTWFSHLLLLGIAGLFAFIAIWSRHNKQSRHTWAWSTLAGLALFMSLGEGAAIHEKTSLLVASYTGDLSGTPLYFAWVVMGIALVGLVGLVFLKFWWNLPTKTKWLLAAGGLFVGVDWR